MCVLYKSCRRLDANAPGSTLLHSAAQHSRSDCIPLLLAAGVDPTAVITKNSYTALRQACNDCDFTTVQLLVQAGGWQPHCALECLARAIVKHKVHVLDVLYEAAATAATAAAAATTSTTESEVTAAAAAGSSAGSSAGSISRRDGLPRGFTLLHVAADARSLSCAEALVRHGAAAAAVVDTTAASTSYGALSPLDMLVLQGPLCSILHTEPAAAQLTDAEFDRFALLLLNCGATIKHSAMSAEEHKRFAGAIQQHTTRLQQQSRRKARVAALHAAACYSQYASSNSSDSSSDAPHKVVKVQLVHSDTQQLGARVYTIDTQLLAQLLSVDAAAANGDSTSRNTDTSTATTQARALVATVDYSEECADSSDSSSDVVHQQAVQQCVLMRMLVPSEGWQCAATDAVTYISCDGKSLNICNICTRILYFVVA
jgi:Ankyrin repeats (many copies)